MEIELKENPRYILYSDGRLYSNIHKKFLKPLSAPRSNNHRYAWGKPGYSGYMINVNGERKFLKIHRLLAKYFIPNLKPKEFKCVIHLDNDKNNWDLENLKWSNQKINMQMYADRRYK